MTALAVVAVAIATELGWPSGARQMRHRLGLSRPCRPVSKRALVSVVAVIGVAMLVGFGGSHVFVAVAAAIGGVTGVRVVAGTRARTRAGLRRRAAVEGLSLVAAELRAGALAESALQSAADEVDLLVGAARAATHGADVVAALRHDSRQPGAELLGDFASAWAVADRSGAPLAGVLTRLADRARDDLDLAAEVSAELAPARATARLMAVLPAFGLALGAGMGGDPVHVLLATTIGGVCLVLGVGFASVGVLWVEKVASEADQ
ncbi:MAG: type II secretion system F family protein [Aeromicrobium sp.]